MLSKLCTFAAAAFSLRMSLAIVISGTRNTYAQLLTIWMLRFVLCHPLIFLLSVNGCNGMSQLVPDYSDGTIFWELIKAKSNGIWCEWHAPFKLLSYVSNNFHRCLWYASYLRARTGRTNVVKIICKQFKRHFGLFEAYLMILFAAAGPRRVLKTFNSIRIQLINIPSTSHSLSISTLELPSGQLLLRHYYI